LNGGEPLGARDLVLGWSAILGIGAILLVPVFCMSLLTVAAPAQGAVLRPSPLEEISLAPHSYLRSPRMLDLVRAVPQQTWLPWARIALALPGSASASRAVPGPMGPALARPTISYR
jgi:hypothetical protein